MRAQGGTNRFLQNNYSTFPHRSCSVQVCGVLLVQPTARCLVKALMPEKNKHQGVPSASQRRTLRVAGDAVTGCQGAGVPSVRAVLQMQIETHSLTLVIHCECRGAQVAACFAFTFTQSQRYKQRLSVQKGAMNDVMKEARGTTQIGRHGVSFEAALVGAVRVRRSRVA